MAANVGDYFDVADPAGTPNYRITAIRHDIFKGPGGPDTHVCRTSLALGIV